MKQKLEELIDKAPPGYFHKKAKEKLPEVKQRLSKAAALMDDLGLRDDRSGEVYVDENSLRKLVKEASPGSEDGVIEWLKRIPGSKLTKGGHGMQKIQWEVLAEKIRLPQTSGPEAAPGPYASFEEIRRAVKQGRPDIPDDAFEPDTLQRASKAVLEAPAHTRAAETGAALPDAAWNCMVRKIGFWGALTLVALAFLIIQVMAVLIVMAIPIVSLTFWSFMWLYVTAVFPLVAIRYVQIIVGCITNPSA
jgi:hypothetical protein